MRAAQPRLRAPWPIALGSFSWLTLLGCSQLAPSPGAEMQAFAPLQAYWQAATVPATVLADDSHVQISEQLFVPAVDQQLAQQPAWYSRPVEVAVAGLSLRALLQQSFAGHAVRQRFADAALAETTIDLAYQGDLGGLLQQLQALHGWHVTITDDEVQWSDWQVAEFDVAFLAGATNFFLGNSNSQQQQSSQNQNTGGFANERMRSEQYLNFSSAALSVWEDLARAIKLLLSAQGSVSINQSSSSVLVRDRPQQVQQVADYLAQQNERLTRQVAIDVQVVEVTFNDTEQFAVDWQALLRTAGGEGVLGLASAQLQTSTQGTQLSWQQQQGRASGSSVILQALSEQGLVQTSRQPRLLSLNNQIAKIVLEDNATYLAASGSTTTANVGSTEILQPGVVTTGFELYVLPSIRAGEVILQLSTELSDLERIDEVRSGDQLIQTPHTSRKKFFMKALVQDGETLLLSGLRHDREQRTEQQAWWSLALGGQQQQQQKRSETLVLLTPHIIGRAQP